MTQRPRSLTDKVEAVPLSYRLPDARINRLAGLMEVLVAESYKGKADFPELADQVGFGSIDSSPCWKRSKSPYLPESEEVSRVNPFGKKLHRRRYSAVKRDICRASGQARIYVRLMSAGSSTNVPATAPRKTGSSASLKITSAKMRQKGFYG